VLLDHNEEFNITFEMLKPTEPALVSIWQDMHLSYKDATELQKKIVGVVHE